MENLPCFPERFTFELRKGSDKKTDALAEKQFKLIEQLCNRDDVDTIVNAGDADREGEIIVRICIEKALKTPKNIKRLWLPDQTPQTVAAAFSDMKDDADYLRSLLPRVFGKYKEKVDGIYITSGVSLELCRYIEENGLDIPLVAFDTYGEIKRYMEKGIISAAISQNVTKQMKVAFEALVRHIMTGKEYPPVLYTDVNLMLKSNMHQFD